MTILQCETFKNLDGPFRLFFSAFRLCSRYNFLNFGFGTFKNLCLFLLLLLAVIRYGSPLADLDPTLQNVPFLVLSPSRIYLV